MENTQNHEFCPDMLSALKNANSILLCCHISPDGDAIGSLLAMGMALRSMGKQVTMACGDPVPAQLRFLPGAAEIVEPEALKGKNFDLALSVDTATVELMGSCADAFFAAPITMQMDHHRGNDGYAQFNAVDGSASAAGCMVRRAMRALDIPLTREIAACLYCAMSTDTGNFRYPNTTAEAFAIMTELMETGFNLAGEARILHSLREVENARLLGRALNSLKIFANGKCACMRITAKDFREAHALPEHNTAIVNYALDLPGVEACFLAEERENGQVKASLRALPGLDISTVARRYGGGGHQLAAGLRYPGTLDALCESLEQDLIALVEGKE